jgi:hypothetical protein
MKFLTHDEAQSEASRLIKHRANSKGDYLPLYYSSGGTDYVAAAEEIVDALCDFKECLFWCTDLPWGDFWGDNDARWSKFYRWRRRLGEVRRLHASPGHLFGANERHLLVETIRVAFYLGWDAQILACPGRRKILMSHDDRVEIHRVPNKRQLVKELQILGFELGEKQ